jgi:N-acetylneuraminic acid mutarotase
MFGILLISLCVVRCDSDNPNASDESTDSPYWVIRAAIPTPRQEIYPGLLDNQIYVVGGFDTSGGMTDAAEVFDPSTNTWSSIPNLPEARHHIGLVGVNGKMYGIGGFVVENSSWVVRGDVFEYDPASSSWSMKAPMPIPHGEHVAAAYEGKVYVIGGRDEGFRNSRHTQIYDPETDTWSEGELMPTARNSAAVAVWNSHIYVIGGRTTGGGIVNLSANEAYSPSTDTWTTLEDMPQAQGGLAASAFNGKIYVFGGEYFEDGSGVFADTWEYDPTADSWQGLIPMLTPRHGTGAVTIGDTVFIVGGADEPGFGAVGTNEGFVVP